MTLVLTLATTLSYGQVGKPKTLKTSFGVKAGLNLSTISNNQSNISFSPTMNAGFHAGAVANLHFGHRNQGSPVGTGIFGLQPELLYSMQGFVAEGNRINFNYISLPIMAKFYVTKGFNIEVGPYFSYLISSAPNSTVINGTQIEMSSLKGGFDVGVGVGLGYETAFGFTVGARYNLGLVDMANNLKWKNNVVAISVGWLF